MLACFIKLNTPWLTTAPDFINLFIMQTLSKVFAMMLPSKFSDIHTLIDFESFTLEISCAHNVMLIPYILYLNL